MIFQFSEMRSSRNTKGYKEKCQKNTEMSVLMSILYGICKVYWKERKKKRNKF